MARVKKVPEGLWAKCPECKAVLYRTELEHNLEVCPRCNHHLRIGARQRLNAFLDAEPRQEIGAELEAVDVHKFKDTKRYRDRLLATQKETAERDALVVMQGTLLGRPLVAAAFEFRFMGGSMGSVVGERFTRGAQVCLDRELPLVCFPPPAARACRKACSPCCRWPRPRPCWPAWARPGCRTSRC